MRYLSYIIAIVSILALYSCGGKVNCTDEPVSLAFKGFDSLSLRGVILIRYSKNTNFTEIIDSTSSGTINSQYAIDSTGFKINNLTYGVFKPDFDYVVYVISNQRRYKVRAITFLPVSKKTHCKLCEEECRNDLTYYLNDSLYKHTGNIDIKPYVVITR